MKYNIRKQPGWVRRSASGLGASRVSTRTWFSLGRTRPVPLKVQEQLKCVGLPALTTASLPCSFPGSLVCSGPWCQGAGTFAPLCARVVEQVTVIRHFVTSSMSWTRWICILYLTSLIICLPRIKISEQTWNCQPGRHRFYL